MNTPINHDTDAAGMHWEVLAAYLVQRGIYTEEAVEEKGTPAFIDMVRNAFSSLKEREQETLILRLGMLDGKHRTLQAVGEPMGISRERARQLEKKALNKIKHWETRMLRKQQREALKQAEDTGV